MTTQPVFNAQQHLTYVDALQILQLVKCTESCESVRLRFGELMIDVERASTGTSMPATQSLRMASPHAVTSSVQPSMPVVDNNQVPDATAGEDVNIIAPSVGFFHLCSETGETLHVQVGDLVHATDMVGIVKAMGVLEPILAGISGRVTEILVTDAGFVEYGQPVLRVKRSGP